MADLIKLDADLDIIQKLDDEPNDVGGLSSAELKAEFDKAGNAIKTYLNDTLIPGIEGTGGEGGLVGDAIAAHNVAPEAHADIRQKITDDVGTHNVAPDAHADIRQEIADNKSETDAAAQAVYDHIADQNNPHNVTLEQIGAVKAPAAPGTDGQVLTQTTSGEPKWMDAPTGLPDGGNPGDVLTRTPGGSAWTDPPEEEVYIGSGVAPAETKLQIDVDAASRVNIPDVLDSTGQSPVDTMSQKAITELVAAAAVPAGGTDGQVLTQTSSGTPQWKDASGGEGGSDAITVPTTLTVGAAGDYPTLNGAVGVISAKYPIYKAGGLKVEVKILAGTTINEQIAVVQNDLQFVTLTAEDAEVPVDATGWTANGLDAHDLREDVAFIGGENAAKLPTVGCKFRLVTPGASPAVGYFANRGSSGVILSGCGFDGFRDGVIANNEASVTAREAVCTNMGRWAVHARHNGEISARSALLTGAGDTAVYADRIADIDARYAVCDGSARAVVCNNASRVNAQRLSARNCSGSAYGLITAESVSTVNADKADVSGLASGTAFSVRDGSTLDAVEAVFGTFSGTRFSQSPGTHTRNGCICADVDNPAQGQIATSDGLGGIVWAASTSQPALAITSDMLGVELPPDPMNTSWQIGPVPASEEVYLKILKALNADANIYFDDGEINYALGSYIYAELVNMIVLVFQTQGHQLGITIGNPENSGFIVGAESKILDLAVPESTSADVGKFLQVGSDGQPTWVAVADASKEAM